LIRYQQNADFVSTAKFHREKADFLYVRDNRLYELKQKNIMKLYETYLNHDS